MSDKLLNFHEKSILWDDGLTRFRKMVSDFVEKECMPNAAKWDKKKSIPRELYRKCYAAGVLTPQYPKEYGGQPPDDGRPVYDFMKIWIICEQFARTGSCGFFTTLYIHSISVPPVLHFGNEYQKQMFAPVIRGEKIAALAISEAGHGSDVARITTTAKKSPCGKFYIVNGNKKWISNGIKADYLVTAVRTGTAESKAKGLSLLIIPRVKGVTSVRIPTQGLWTSETAQIFFKDVKVPVENLIGKEGTGFTKIVLNFNQERYSIVCQALGSAMECLRIACDYARKRVVFGKKLVESQVIRHKIAEMSRQIIATYNFMEKCAFQLSRDPLGFTDQSVGTNVALCKVQATRTFEFCAREASQILGGKSYVLHSKIDRLYRDVRALAIYGGSEEIMADLSTRLAKL